MERTRDVIVGAVTGHPNVILAGWRIGKLNQGVRARVRIIITVPPTIWCVHHQPRITVPFIVNRQKARASGQIEDVIGIRRHVSDTTGCQIHRPNVETAAGDNRNGKGIRSKTGRQRGATEVGVTAANAEVELLSFLGTTG